MRMSRENVNVDEGLVASEAERALRNGSLERTVQAVNGALIALSAFP